MNFKTIYPVLAGILAAGCSSEVYDSSVTETAPLQLAVVWERQDAAVPLPEAYTALLPETASLRLAGDVPLLGALPTGASRLLLFNIPTGMTAEGSVLTVSPGSGAEIGWLFTAAQDIYIRPLTDNCVGIRMKQRTRELRFRVGRADGMAAVRVELDAASRLDVEYNRLFDPATVTLDLTPDGNASFAGTARILGLVGTSLDIRFTFDDADATQRRYLLSVPADAFGGRGLPSPLQIDLTADGECYRAEISSDSGRWQVELSQIVIDNNDPNKTTTNSNLTNMRK